MASSALNINTSTGQHHHLIARPASPSYLNAVHDESNPLLGVYIDRPSTPGIAQRQYLSHPIISLEQDYQDSLPTTPAGHPSFTAQPRANKPLPSPTLYSRARLFLTQLGTNAISTLFLILIVIWALSSRALAYLTTPRKPKEPQRPWDQPDKWRHEHLVKDVKYYAAKCGYKIVDQTVETEDGYYLRVHKVVVPGKEGLKADGRGGWPVIIQHGLFQTSGSFVTSEERSLAFWLADHGFVLFSNPSLLPVLSLKAVENRGYQVYLTNNRAVFDMGHRTFKRSDPRFWGASSPAQAAIPKS